MVGNPSAIIDKEWVLEPYPGNGRQAKDPQTGELLFRILAKSGNTNDVAYTTIEADENGAPVQNADGTYNVVSVDNINKNKYARLLTAAVATRDYEGGENGNTVWGVYSGDTSYELEMNWGFGDLLIREVTTGNEQGAVAQTEIVETGDVMSASAAASATGNGRHAGVVAPDGTVYTINGNVDWLPPQQASIRLFYDDILATAELPDGASEPGASLLIRTTMENADYLNLTDPENRNYIAKYIDLVDYNNGNVWMKASNEVVVYLPYPDGVSKDNAAALDLQVEHFAGIHRGYNGGYDYRTLIANAVANKGDRNIGGTNKQSLLNVDIEYTDYGIRFTIDQQKEGFSPIIISWLEPVEIDVPQTGDEMNFMRLAAAMALCGAGLYIVRRKRDDE